MIRCDFFTLSAVITIILMVIKVVANYSGLTAKRLFHPLIALMDNVRAAIFLLIALITCNYSY